MVVGLDLFREHFAEYPDQYVLIGGTAMYLVLDEAALETRATKDLDIVLCVEALNPEFVAAFWRFVRAGEYEYRQRSTGEKVFYRFSRPADTRYPFMLELFSRSLDNIDIAPNSELTPVPVAEEVSSLSAILLDEEYYGFLQEQKREIDGISLASETCLIPFKARAYLDLAQRREAGDHVDRKDINKHRKDVFRLYQLLLPEQTVDLPERIREDLTRFLEIAEAEVDDPSLKQLGIKGTSVAEVAETIRAVYQIGDEGT